MDNWSGVFDPIWGTPQQNLFGGYGSGPLAAYGQMLQSQQPQANQGIGGLSQVSNLPNYNNNWQIPYYTGPNNVMNGYSNIPYTNLSNPISGFTDPITGLPWNSLGAQTGTSTGTQTGNTQQPTQDMQSLWNLFQQQDNTPYPGQQSVFDVMGPNYTGGTILPQELSSGSFIGALQTPQTTGVNTVLNNLGMTTSTSGADMGGITSNAFWDTLNKYGPSALAEATSPIAQATLAEWKRVHGM